MIESLLIANRGEIARRVIRTARRMGVRTIAVHSEPDAAAPHVREADEAVCIGPAAARDSYLSAERILAAARETKAAAIHPGYGFLAENADFAQAVIDAGLVWVGPPPGAIRTMGRKDAAKALMARAGVVTTPGYMGEDQSPERLRKEADAIGYPVLIKAVAGGGGKGMRKVDRAEDFHAALAACRREAGSSFGDERVLLEIYVQRPRHIEVQVFADRHGNAVHLFERDCSLQRRHQKVIEEAPAPGMDAATRAAICGAAVRAARAVAYEGAGTIEFIADASDGLKADRIWFMEMNTRLQVEHPVTEMVTGQDLVEWQLRVASGEPLPLTQDELKLDGWAMEARLYAENPATGFLPSTGTLTHFKLPDGIRIDSAVARGDAVTPFYDPMIAKLIVHAGTRVEAAAKLAEACRAVEVWPVRTNAAFLARALTHPDFVAMRIHTGFIVDHLDTLVPDGGPSPAAVRGAAGYFLDRQPVGSQATPWDLAAGFRLNAPARLAIVVQNGAELYPVDLAAAGAPAVQVVAVGGDVVIFDRGEAHAFTLPAGRSLDDRAGGDGSVISPMPGLIVQVHVKAGDRVAKGAPLLVLEAMKMEHGLTAPFDGTVTEVNISRGDQVAEGVALARLERA